MKMFLRQLQIKKGLLQISMLLILTSALLGCSWLQPKKETILNSEFCLKYHSLNFFLKEVEVDFKTISNELYRYINVNETTYICECLEGYRKKQCYDEFLEIL